MWYVEIIDESNFAAVKVTGVFREYDNAKKWGLAQAMAGEERDKEDEWEFPNWTYRVTEVEVRD